jgi:glycolate oxidase
VKGLSTLADEFSGDLLSGEAELLAYSYDGALDRHRPDGVALARSAADVQAAVRWCHQEGVPFTARGAGTNLSGGCVPLKGGLILSTAPMNRILEIDTEQELAVVEPGVVNQHLQQALAPLGRFYAPDPASLKVCTLGGNIAENSGGPRCLKYGTTTNHVRAVEIVLPDGSLQRFSTEDVGPEILSLLIGAEGTLGVVTRVWVDLTRTPEVVLTSLAAFPTLDAAMECVGAIIAGGILPRVLEAMDRMTVQSIESYIPCGLPDGEAVLLIEVEGERYKAGADLEGVRELCERHGAGEFRTAQSAAETERLWQGRRSAYAALARLAPNVMVEDGVVPRDKLAEAARIIRRVAADEKVEPALLFHAGDGNLHPNMIFDERDKALTHRTRRAGARILEACVELGGSISGEHGIGIDKRAAMGWLFPPETLDLFRAIKKSFDPQGLANPDKLFPLPSDESKSRLRKEAALSDPAQSLIERVRELAETESPLTVIGSGTRVPQGLRQRGETLTVRPLCSVLEFDRANYVLRVEAGITPAELKAQVEGERMHVPVPMVRGTLGGIIATKAWPGLRDHLLGMRVLLADGRVCTLGARVVKSVAGYDVPRLLLGSWGTLAIILDVTLKVYPFPVEAPSTLSVPPKPGMGKWHQVLKKAFDPDARLNRWVEEHAGAA